MSEDKTEIINSIEDRLREVNKKHFPDKKNGPFLSYLANILYNDSTGEYWDFEQAFYEPLMDAEEKEKMYVSFGEYGLLVAAEVIIEDEKEAVEVCEGCNEYEEEDDFIEVEPKEMMNLTKQYYKNAIEVSEDLHYLELANKVEDLVDLLVEYKKLPEPKETEGPKLSLPKKDDIFKKRF